MSQYLKKVWIGAIMGTFILFFHAFSFAQYESIKGVQFTDGSIIYGKVIEMNTDDIRIETKDGKIISRKFNDVLSFKNDSGGEAKQGVKRTAENQIKKEIFNIAVGTEIMSGNTTYQIGYPFTVPDGTTYNGYFPFSKLEWPLDIWLVRLDAGLNMGDRWRINGVLKKNLSTPSDNMQDSDWLTDSNPSQLDIYSESDISKFDAWIFDIDLEWDFLKRQSWSLYAGLGWQYQHFDYESKLIHQYSPSGMPDVEYYGDGRLSITYDITYSMPYLKIGSDFKINNRFSLAGSFVWSPLVNANDEDNHLLRENGGKICTGDMDGKAYMIDVSAKYNFTPSWFLKGGFHFIKIDVDGEQYQVYGDGTALGTVNEESESTQTSFYLTVGYTF